MLVDTKKPTSAAVTGQVGQHLWRTWIGDTSGLKKCATRIIADPHSPEVLPDPLMYFPALCKMTCVLGSLLLGLLFCQSTSTLLAFGFQNSRKRGNMSSRTHLLATPIPNPHIIQQAKTSCLNIVTMSVR